MKNIFVCELQNLMNEWDYKNNDKNGYDPYKIKTGSSQKVHWICAKGHRWIASVSNRARGTTCPYCSNKKILKGYNDLKTTNPILCMEWDYNQNGDLKPSDVMAGSRKKVWWVCAHGHKWQASIVDRNRGSRCPECAKEKHTSFQEQAFYYYLKKSTTALNREKICGKEIDIYLPELNIGIEYNGSYYHKGKEDKDNEKIQLLTDYGIKMFIVKESDNDFVDQNIINYRFGKSLDWAIVTLFSMIGFDIPIVNTKIDRNKIWEQYIYSEKENSLAIKYPEIAAEWHPTKNGRLTPELISYGSTKKVWWLGKCGHEWDATVERRTICRYRCPICSGRRIVPGINDLATTHPHLLNEWCYEKNTNILPSQATHGSQKKVWWKCNLGHIYDMRVHHKSSGIGCPVCSGQRILSNINDLATLYPELLPEWDYEKNAISPNNISPSSKIKVWWKCERQHSWEASILNRAKHKTSCPVCSQIRRITKNVRNTSGVIGVSFHNSCQKWHALIQYNKQSISLKYYDKKEDAIYARLMAEVKYYGYDNAPQRHLFEQYGIKTKIGDDYDTKT